MTVDPSHGRFNALETIEFDPNPFSDRRPFDELNLAPLERGIENSHAKSVKARTSDANFGRKRYAVRASGQRSIVRVRSHGLRVT
jgi:hypothetical protein